ncbi:MAG: amidohydrolase [Oscillibacter sp.]|nr:amidohydrolase [Oscillibacter sp.]
MFPSVTDHRRALHRIPELDDQLPETLDYVTSLLRGLPCALTFPIPGSVCAYFDAGRQETVAFRADLDALPVEEATDLPYASRHPSVMHACGHDGHTAMVLALAQWLSQQDAASLRRNVLLVFQPAEETTGGAGRICESGILEQLHVTRIFGLHLWPGLAAGTLASRPGPLMARSNEVTVTLTGKSVHLSRAAEGRDALMAGAEYLRRVYGAMDALPPEQLRVLRFGKMTSGTVRNAVSGRTVLEGSLRTYDEPTHRACRDILDRTARDIAEETGCGAEVCLSEGYPPVWNHEGLHAAVCAALGPEAPAELSAPSLAAEDFSFYQRRVPGVFFFLGVGDTAELHAPTFTFDDVSILPKGVAFLQRLALLP